MLTYSTGDNNLTVSVYKSRGISLNNYIDVHTGKCIQIMTNHSVEHQDEGYHDGFIGLGCECVFEHYIADDDNDLFDDYINDDELKALNNVMKELSLEPSYYIVTHFNKTVEVSIIFDKDKKIDRFDVEHRLPTQIRLDNKTIYINAAY